MKIAVTGAQGMVGRHVVKCCEEAGHTTVRIDLPNVSSGDKTSNSEIRSADIAADYEATVKALEGCDAVIHLAAIPNPVGRPESLVHYNNVQAAFNGFRACGELGIKRICYVSSVNAIGLAFSNQPLKFKYFPIDENYPPDPTDCYALAKLEAETQAKAFVNWFPGMKIACLRMHQVELKEEVERQHEEAWEKSAVRSLWSYLNPQAAARACLLAVEKANNFEGCEIFNIVAPESTQEVESKELAKKWYPDAEIRPGLEGTAGFWSTDKAQRILGWKHDDSQAASKLTNGFH